MEALAGAKVALSTMALFRLAVAFVTIRAPLCGALHACMKAFGVE